MASLLICIFLHWCVGLSLSPVCVPCELCPFPWHHVLYCRYVYYFTYTIPREVKLRCNLCHCVVLFTQLTPLPCWLVELGLIPQVAFWRAQLVSGWSTSISRQLYVVYLKHWIPRHLDCVQAVVVYSSSSDFINVAVMWWTGSNCWENRCFSDNLSLT